MKKIAILVCLTLLVSLFAVNVSATGETVTSTLNFADLSIGSTEDMAAAVQAIKDLGAVEASNLIVFDCYTKCVAGKGYAGPGYFVQRIDAGEGKVFAEAPVLTLNYRLANADPEGYIKVEGSIDGVTYYPFAELNEITGESYTEAAKATATVTLNGGEGSASVWVKITVEHWGAPDAAAVDCSTITATVKANPSAEPVVPENEAVNTLDFSMIAIGGTEDMAAAVQAIKDLGAVDASNLIIFDCYTKCAAGKGYAGPGYFIQKLDAGEGKVFAEAPVLTLNYRLANADPEGYITVEYSVDGVTFVSAAELDEITGESYTDTAKATATVTLTDAVNAGSVWVKITMEHWGAPDAAAVDASTIRAAVTDAPVEPQPSEPETQPTEPSVPETEPTKPVDPDSPGTGDAFGIVVAMMAASGLALIALKKKEN